MSVKIPFTFLRNVENCEVVVQTYMYLNQLMLYRALSIVVQTYKTSCSEFIFFFKYFLGNGPSDTLWIYQLIKGLLCGWNGVPQFMFIESYGSG